MIYLIIGLIIVAIGIVLIKKSKNLPEKTKRILSIVCFSGLLCLAAVCVFFNVIRKSSVKIELPDTPAYYSSFDYSDNYEAEYKLTDITYEIDGNDLVLTFEGKKTYDVDGEDELGDIQIVWRLFDSNNNVVASDEVDSPKIKVGETFSVKSEDYKFNIDFNEDYKLVVEHFCDDASKYEEKLIGTWAGSSSEGAVIYSFYRENGKYKASCGSSVYDKSDPDIWLFDKFTATSKTVTLYSDGKNITFEYSFKNGCLWFDGMMLEPSN